MVTNAPERARATVREAVLEREAKNTASDIAVTSAFWRVTVESTARSLEVESITASFRNNRYAQREIILLRVAFARAKVSNE